VRHSLLWNRANVVRLTYPVGRESALLPGLEGRWGPAGYDNDTPYALGRQASADARYSPCARSRRHHGVPGFMITVEMMQTFFSDTRQKNIEMGKDWSIDEVCR